LSKITGWWRRASKALLSATSDIRSVGVAGTVADAVRLDGAVHPDVILMDFRLPDGTGAEATAQIRRQHRAVPVLFLSTDDGEDTLIAAVRAGGCGYLSKSRAATEVAAAVRRAAEGEMLIPPPSWPPPGSRPGAVPG